MGSLEGRVALVTGVSRRQGIGYATATRLAGLGADSIDEVINSEGGFR